MNDAEPLAHDDALAIIGMAGRFPGARNLDEFWHNLREGVESVSFFSEGELELAGMNADALHDPRLVRAGGVLEEAEMFDAAFFGFSPREAEITDPQQRLFLECAWEALEDAGYDPEKCPGLVGVYAGVSMNTYLVNLYSRRDLVETVGHLQIGIGNDKDFMPTRVSYKLNLKGPSVAVQTACSTSLVAVHLACQSLLDGQCDMALAGGASVTLPQKTGYFYQEGGIHSPDGHCRAFDARAGGFVKGNGCGVVVLKRLADAVADGDCIQAVVRGSAVNNDGSLKVGYTAPSEVGQSEVIASALAMAEVEPDTVSYVEAHGTGTALGDPIEVAALSRVFAARTRRKGFCALGSVKTNVGHLDAAAGVAGLIKTVLALKARKIPPSLNFEEPNPQIDFAGSPFFVNHRLREWEADGGPRRAGVSSFGIGGTNAHVVLEEAPSREAAPSRWPAFLLTLSARTETALESATSNLARHLRRHPDVNPADAAYTLQVGRKQFGHRRAVVCRDAAGAAGALETLDPARVVTGRHEGGERPAAFMFSGQGAQYVNMGRELYEVEPTFRDQLDLCARLLAPHLGFDLRAALYPPAGQSESAARQLVQTRVTQPALFAVEYALARVWMNWGVRPQALIGHSVGEFVAACLAGVFTLEEGLRLMAVRGRLMQALPPGDMLAVPLAEDEVRRLLARDGLSLAAVNGRASCVVAGARRAVEEFESGLRERGVECRRLETSHAFHSSMMDAVVGPFVEEVRKVRLRAPELPYVSGVTGRWIEAGEARDPAYWGRHLRETVRFGDGVAELLKGPHALIEVGPGQTLCALARREAGGRTDTPLVSTLRRPTEDVSDVSHLLKSVGRLWTSGVAFDWEKLYEGERRGRIQLPSYPFERERFWVEAGRGRDPFVTPPATPEKKKEIADWFYVPVWKETAWPAPPGEGDARLGQTRWLVFADECGLSQSLFGGQSAVTVRAGARFERVSDEEFVVNPAQRADYTALLAELRAAGKTPEAICHAWNVTAAGRDAGGVSPSGVSLDAPFYSLLFLAQALGEESLAGGHEGVRRRIFILSNNMQEVTGEDLTRPEKATLLGPCRVIPQEYPHLTCRSVDLSLPAPGSTQYGRLLLQLTAELASDSREAVVAYRGGHRWSQGFEAVRLEGREGRPPRLREGGVYLVTGGLGGVGFEVAEHLARAVRARLVLVGRTPLPPQEEWAGWLAAHDELDEVSRRIRKARRLLDAGAEALFVRADVTRREELQAALDLARERFGALHGVVHAAGVPGEGLMQLKTAEAAADVLAPKVAGTLLLDELLGGEGLDFMVLFSSLRSVQGGVGHGDYCAANAFLDAFARYKTSAGGTFTQSINWGGWQETGMSVDFMRRHGFEPAEALKEGMTSAEGVEAFGRALATGLPQVIVVPQDLEGLLAEGDAEAGAKSAEPPSAARAAHQRPALGNEYVAPRNEAERLVAELWQELLGIERVGVHDNFFELGGDSILSLRIIARANQAGLQLSPKQIFEHQTVAALAAAAGTSVGVTAEQGLVSGVAPLTPVQRWFFEQEFADPHHWNQAVLLEARRPVEPRLLERALRHLLEHHDALRLRFRRTEAGWEQYHSEPAEDPPLRRVDLAGTDEAEQERAVEAHAAEAQASLRLAEGPLLRAVAFDFGPARAGRLLLVAHHLVVDAVSWRIILEDVTTAYEQLAGGRAVRLPPKTTSFGQWARRLAEFARSPDVAGDAGYWLEGPREAAPLPLDYAGGANTVASARGVSVSLSGEETAALLQEVPSVYQTQINDALLTALSLTLAGWAGARSVLINLEGHGREAVFDDLDVSRTVGWFTSVFPVFVEPGDGADIGEALRSVKEQLRRVPRHGLSYGLLRYNGGPAAERLSSLPQPEVGFLYLGQFDRESSASSLFGLAGAGGGSPQSPRARRSHLLDVDGHVADGRLRLTWTYSADLHRAETVTRLAEECAERLRALVRHCRTAAVSYTPADFPEAGLSQKELDALMASLAEPED